MDIDGFREFVAESHWRFAKTYAKFAPHEYTMRDKCQRGPTWYREAVQLILDQGTVEKFYGKPDKYLYVDGYKYWTMVTDAGKSELCNRASMNMCLSFNHPWLPPDGEQHPGKANHGNIVVTEVRQATIGVVTYRQRMLALRV